MNTTINPPAWHSIVPPIFIHSVSDYTAKNHVEHPWIDGDEIAATNGHICVRAPLSMLRGELPPFPEGYSKPPYRPLFLDRRDYEDVPLVLGKIPSVRKRTCGDCLGSAERKCDCEHCQGHPCDYCVGGIVTEEPKEAAEFGGLILAVKYLRVMRDHGCTLYARRGRHRAKNAVFFTVPDGCTGLLMPMSPGTSGPDARLDWTSLNHSAARSAAEKGASEHRDFGEYGRP